MAEAARGAAQSPFGAALTNLARGQQKKRSLAAFFALEQINAPSAAFNVTWSRYLITLLRESNRRPKSRPLETCRLTRLHRFCKSKRAAEFSAVRKAVRCDQLEDNNE
jgi:hypothetical protein